MEDFDSAIYKQKAISDACFKEKLKQKSCYNDKCLLYSEIDLKAKILLFRIVTVIFATFLCIKSFGLIIPLSRTENWYYYI